MKSISENEFCVFDMDIKLNIPAIEKLLDYTASGIGSIAGPYLAPWKARREVKSKLIMAEGDANILTIQAEAQAKARDILISQNTDVTGELTITSAVEQRIQFQEEKRQVNIKSVVQKAADQLGDKEVTDSEPDHDWTARFFNEVQDVSSEEMQLLWAKVLAGEVQRPGSTSIRTLGILKNLDRNTAQLFIKFCSACMFMTPDGKHIIDARVPSLGGNAASNSLQSYGLGFDALNRLNESGLIIPDYNSWRDYGLSILNPAGETKLNLPVIPFNFQDRRWVLIRDDKSSQKKDFELHGVAMTLSAIELSKVIELQPMENFRQALLKYYRKHKLVMTELTT